MIRTLIVDDEPLAGEILETYISQLPNIQLVGRCFNALEANEMLQNERVDLLLLDIEMPILRGVDFLKQLSSPPLVIFTTAYPEFAVEGFNLNAIDYLLKPISFERFLKAINKVTEKLKLQAAPEKESSFQDYIFVKADKKLVKLNFSDILYIEGLKDYVIIRTESGRVITLQTMKSLEDKLPPSLFLRIHRSYIVNLKKINSIIGQGVEVIEKAQAKLLPVGKNYKDSLELLVDQSKL
ncbi:MAG: response regulator transcription factor [Saprospiraceae bacterium]|jgi:DNA-binding LytR/AlgR family response regulator|nr:response regulator transcription factor [Saprospiraceae bacterium]MBK7797396.1 response regulator transcription factor [Saprospiraceae bacterium]MBL0261489.1 response regulator transcription factor [Saprospiraceae bacterium]